MVSWDSYSLSKCHGRNDSYMDGERNRRGRGGMRGMGGRGRGRWNTDRPGEVFIVSTWLTSLCMLLVVCFIFLALFDFGRKDTGVKLICLLTFMQS